MVLYTIKLNEYEVEELDKVISKGSHTSHAYRAADILLNCDKGEFSTNIDIKNSDICKILHVEIKAITKLEDVHLAQAINYLEAYNLEIGLLINFGAKSLEFKRLINSKYNGGAVIKS